MTITTEELRLFASASPRLTAERRKAISQQADIPKSPAALWLEEARTKCRSPLNVDWGSLFLEEFDEQHNTDVEDLERECRQLRIEAISLMEDNRIEDALRVADECSEGAESLPPSSAERMRCHKTYLALLQVVGRKEEASRLEGEIAHKLGLTAKPSTTTKNRFEEVAVQFEQAIASADWQSAARIGDTVVSSAMAEYGIHSSQAAFVMGRVSDVNVKIGAYDQAACLLKMALPILEIQDPPDSSSISTCYLNLGDVCMRVFRFDEALHFLASAAKMRQENNDDAGFATALSKIGSVEGFMGSYDRAINTLSQVVAIRTEFNGERSLETAMALDNLASAQLGASKTVEALFTYEQALDVFESLGESANFDKAICLDTYGSALCFAGRLDAALKSHERAIILLEALSPAADNDMAKCLQNLGECYLFLDQKPKAFESFIRAKALTERHGHLEPLAHAALLNSLAAAFGELEDSSTAQQYLDEAHTLLTQGELAQHPLLAAVLNNLAVLASQSGDKQRAEDLYREAEKASSPRCIEIVRGNLQKLLDDNDEQNMIQSNAA